MSWIWCVLFGCIWRRKRFRLRQCEKCKCAEVLFSYGYIMGSQYAEIWMPYDGGEVVINVDGYSQKVCYDKDLEAHGS